MKFTYSAQGGRAVLLGVGGFRTNVEVYVTFTNSTVLTFVLDSPLLQDAALTKNDQREALSKLLREFMYDSIIVKSNGGGLCEATVEVLETVFPANVKPLQTLEIHIPQTVPYSFAVRALKIFAKVKVDVLSMNTTCRAFIGVMERCEFDCIDSRLYGILAITNDDDFHEVRRVVYSSKLVSREYEKLKCVDDDDGDGKEYVLCSVYFKVEEEE